jgi:hypothetical protein
MKSSQFLKNLSCRVLFVGLVFTAAFAVRARADAIPVGAPIGRGANLTFTIEENNSTEAGQTIVPIIDGQPRLKLGQLFIPGDSTDSLRIQVDSLDEPTMYFLSVSSDNNTDLSPGDQETYVATNPDTGRSVTYIIKSDSETPEPGSMVLFGTGLLTLAGYLKRRLT